MLCCTLNDHRSIRGRERHRLRSETLVPSFTELLFDLGLEYLFEFGSDFVNGGLEYTQDLGYGDARFVFIVDFVDGLALAAHAYQDSLSEEGHTLVHRDSLSEDEFSKYRDQVSDQVVVGFAPDVRPQPFDVVEAEELENSVCSFGLYYFLCL